MIFAAGILFVTADGQALFLKRGAGGDHPGLWGFPAGRQEGDESLQECALREAEEECGPLPKDLSLQFWARRVKYDPPQAVEVAPNTISPSLPAPLSAPGTDGTPLPGEPVDFTTFICRISAPFPVKISDESTGAAWTQLATPPEPLHPGCRVALDRLNCDELGVARLIAAGELTSPQKYDNVWLYALRITGTGTAYRKKLDEHVYRPPEHYLNDEFLARCNGLPVLWQHPAKSVLNSEEFAERIVGSIFLPYIVADEVWGIAKIHDAEAAEILLDEQWSTSPAVVFRNRDTRQKVALEDGSTLLIEGDPSLLDHLAICRAGVWDKGGPPAGVRSDNQPQEKSMPDIPDKKADEARTRADAAEGEKKEEKKEEERSDADAGQKLDKLLTCMDGIGSRLDTMNERMDRADARMDAMDPDKKAEEAKADKRKDSAKKDGENEETEKTEAKEVAADKRKDAEEKEDKEKAEREDSARADALVDRVLTQVRGDMPKQLTDEQYAQFADEQARCDEVAVLHGKHAPRPMQGETLAGYRRRLIGMFQAHSTDWKDVPLVGLDGKALEIAQNAVYAAARADGLSPASAPEGTLREVVRPDATGRQVRTFIGQPSAWMRDFKSPARRVGAFVTKGS